MSIWFWFSCFWNQSINGGPKSFGNQLYWEIYVNNIKINDHKPIYFTSCKTSEWRLDGYTTSWFYTRKCINHKNRWQNFFRQGITQIGKCSNWDLSSIFNNSPMILVWNTTQNHEEFCSSLNGKFLEFYKNYQITKEFQDNI